MIDTLDRAWVDIGGSRGRSYTNRILRHFYRPRSLLPAVGIVVCSLAILSISFHPFVVPRLLGDDADGFRIDEEQPAANEPVSESHNPYFWKGDVWTHNEAVSAKLERCEALGLLRVTRDPLPNLSAEEEAHRMSLGCGTNETTVVILSSIYQAEAFGGDMSAGEVVWAQSVISTLNAYGYSYMFSSLGWYNHDMAKTMEYWWKHRGQIRLILSDPEQVDVCFHHKNQNCLQRQDNPKGVEPWRILSFWYWDE